MSSRWSRTAVAAVLTSAGVLIPCSAWFVAGTRSVRERASTIADAPHREAGAEARRMARQLALRLEALRESESRRSFQDYLSSERLAQLQGDCAEEGATPSPLAEGPVDPLIRAHFQIDDVGVVTLPALGRKAQESDPGRDAGATGSIEQAVLHEIECASSEHLAALRRTTDGIGPSRHLPSPRGLVTVGPFSWHTASIEGDPALVALREVSTPAAVLTQGFVVPAGGLEALITGSPYPVAFLPGAPPQDESAAMVPLQGDSWYVRVDAARAVEAAYRDASRVESRFRRTFVLGALAALVAATSLVLLVRGTERTARERARFAAAAAHELRTPLAGLQLYGEMLAEGTGDPSRSGDYARRVADEAQRLGRVVSNVLGYSRLQRGGLHVSPRDAELEPAVRDSLERARPALDSQGVTVRLHVEDRLPRARFDPDALHQILINLLDNAAKFNRDATDRSIGVTLCARDGCPTLEVRDHGCGIDRAVRRRLFRPFARHPDPNAPAGLGVGLAIVRALARAQGAGVSVHDPPDGGAAFVVSFQRGT